jgi:hypothetical protein
MRIVLYSIFLILIFFNQSFSQQSTKEVQSVPFQNDSTSFEKNTSQKIGEKALVLAFTVGTGLVGGHRLVLGTKPIVPIVYAATLGGGLGILPLIDFVAILIKKDYSMYKNNPKIFMWAE